MASSSTYVPSGLVRFAPAPEARDVATMTDAHATNGTIPQPVAKKPFPIVRLFYSLGFAVLAWLAFWMLLVLGTVQFVVLLVTGRVNEELKTFNLNLLQYLWELFAFIIFVRDDQPFPIGPFPKSHAA
jgi:hypothetical protein